MVASVLMLVLSGCRVDVTGLFTSHRDGQMADFPSTITVSGVIPAAFPVGGVLRVEGVETPYADIAVDPDRSWTANVAVDPAHPVTQLETTYTVNGVEHRQILSIVDNPSSPDVLGTYAEDGVGMRFTNTGLAGLGPIIQDLAAGSFDLNALLVGQAVNTSDATGTIYEAGAGNISLTPVSTASGVRAPVTIRDMYIGVDLNVSTLGIGSCRLDVVVPTATIDGYYDLAPAGDDANNVDVNLLGGTPGATNRQPSVSIPTVNYEFTAGACDPDTPIIGGIISGIAGSSVPDAIRSSFVTELQDPDGTGPGDSPIADAVEDALGGISIAGAVGSAVESHLDAPLQDVTEDASGMTFRSDADFGTVDPLTGLPTCAAPAGAPDIAETGTVPSTFPAMGATTPSGAPYGLGLAISSSAFNQMIGAMTECGLLNSTITELLGQPISPAVLALAMPQFANLIPQGVHQMEIRIRPTAAPYLTGNAGPNGEPAELYIANLQLDFVSTHLVHDGVVTEAPDGGVKWLTVAIDAPFGFDLTWDDVAGALQPTITLPPTAAVRARVVFNNIQVNAVSTESLVQALFPSMASGLTDTFAAFPLPGFLGLSLDVAEIAESNNTYLLYANLTPAPSTHMENFTLTDVGSANSADDDSGSDSNEWRHRIRKSWGSTAANVTFQSSISADSIVLADEEKGATGAYRMNFTIVPETAGGPWRLELDHNILGAYTCRSEGLGGGTCRMGFYTTSMGTNSPINGSVKVNGGAAQAFNFNPSPQGAGEAGGNFNTQFSGSGSRVITGTGTATIEVNYSFGQRAGSYCGGFICGGDGHEASIRMGLGDTLSNNFTAGEYPGQGNRTQGNDGHRSNLKLCTNTGVACP